VNDYDALAARWKALRAAADLSVREVACVGAPRTLLCAERGDAHAPLVALCAGVHGDEPAGVWALLELFETPVLPNDYAYRIWPCTNPSGFHAGTRENAEGTDVNRTFGRGGTTPEARAMLTANRDRKYALSIDLHEDCDAPGFYCYEYGVGDIGHAVVDAVRGAGYSIADPGTCDLGSPLDAPAFDDGVVRPDAAGETKTIGGLSYSMSIVRRAALRALTFETPQCLPLRERMTIHTIAVKAALTALSKQHPHG